MASSAAMGSAPGSYQRWLATAALVVLPFMVVVLVMTAQFRGVELPAALEQGVVARRLAAGQGYTTAVILPRSLAYNASLTAHPELRQAPLSVLPAAVLSRAMGEREGRVLAFSSMLAFLATVWLCYAFARALGGVLAAWTAALLVTFAPAVLSAS
ncbi:MAG: hypothetical protein HUU35_13855, partial [Armatimonadetes bacterium]|nr:hypothetical protein [Armatimonadota bacterium]